MKKLFAGVIALAVAASAATAGVGVLWSASWGGYDHTVGDLSGGSGALLDSYSAIWQLIYAGPDNTIDPIPNPVAVVPSEGGPGIADNFVYGDDVVWGERRIAQGGGSGNDAPYNTDWSNWMTWNSGDNVYENLSWSTAGFVYQRIFEGAPAANSWYFESGPVALLTDYTPSGGPQSFYIGSDNSGFKPTQQIIVNAIPEPATMSLLGLGALVMAIRRRRT